MLQVVIGYNLVLPFLLFLLYTIFNRKKSTVVFDDFEPDYAIIVTAYQEIDHIPLTVESILKLNYKKFICYIVLDNCDDTSSLKFNDDRIILLKPDKVLAGNVRSHFFAIKNFKRKHQYLTIIDSDNIVHENYLNELNKYFARGYLAVQGIREAKNTDTEYAGLDAARDIYYHFYDGLILYSLGSSATLAGSGMAFKTSLYIESLGNVNVQGAGFDKVLQYEIVKRNFRIAYADSAIVYDQKTSKPSQLVNQRARWINTWFKYFKFGFKLFAKGIIQFSINQILFGLILLRPPLFIFLLLSILFAIINIVVSLPVFIGWVLGLIIFVISFIISLRYYGASSNVIRSLKRIPNFVFYQLISLKNSRKANQKSVATKHFD